MTLLEHLRTELAAAVLVDDQARAAEVRADLDRIVRETRETR